MPKWLENGRAKNSVEHGTNIQLFLVTLMSNLPYMMLACIPLFRVRPEASLRPPPHFLHRPSDLRASHPHVRLRRDHANRARNNRTQPRGPRSDCGIGLSRSSGSRSVVQIFLSIRRVYRQGWFISIFKFLLADLFI